MSDYTELELIEAPTIELFAELGWRDARLLQRALRPERHPRAARPEARRRPRSRDSAPRLRSSTQHFPPPAITEAIERSHADRSATASASHANQEVWELLRDGVKVAVAGRARATSGPRPSRVIDWNDPEQQRLPPRLAVLDHRRPLHAPARPRRLRQRHPARPHRAQGRRTRRSKTPTTTTCATTTTPSRSSSGPTRFIILSNGSESRVGTITAALGALRRVEADRRRGRAGRRLAGDDASAAPASRRACSTSSRTSSSSPTARGGLVKLVAKNHQFLGVNNARSTAAGTTARPTNAGQARRLLAHPGSRQEPLDALVHPEGAAHDARQLDLRDGHRPRRAGRPDLQERSPTPARVTERHERPGRQSARTCASCCARTTATSSR